MATHRMRVLELVDRIIVIDNGLVALDDTKDRALLVLRGLGNVKSAGPAAVSTETTRPIQENVGGVNGNSAR